MADPTADHRTHDLEAVAALADDRSVEGEARQAEAARCADCAALLGDLRLLATATAALPAPARARDFRLDPADAARLRSMSPEPAEAPGRLGREMTTPAADHAAHDPELVAAHLDGRLAAADRDRVDGWLADCGACAELRRDIEDLVLATRALPTPSRPRDFSLTPEDARRARAGGWRRFVAAIGSPRDAFSRPLAVGLTTMGIAGLLIANAPSFLTVGGGATAGAPAPEMQLAAPSAGPSAAPAYEPDQIDTAAGEAPGDTTGEAPVDTRGEAAASAASGAGIAKSSEPAQRDGSADLFNQAVTGETAAGPSWLVIGSVAMLLVGLTLAMLRWRARRLGDG